MSKNSKTFVATDRGRPDDGCPAEAAGGQAFDHHE